MPYNQRIDGDSKKPDAITVRITQAHRAHLATHQKGTASDYIRSLIDRDIQRSENPTTIHLERKVEELQKLVNDLKALV